MGKRLEGRVAIVTGAGRGIGAEVATWLAADGASVIVNDLGGAVDGTGTSDAPAEQVAAEIRDNGGEATANFDSVAEFDTAGKVVQSAIDKYGRLDIVCHVAGILRDRMIFNMTELEWDGVLDVHLYGAFNMVRHATPHMMRQKHGRIVLFSSGSGLNWPEQLLGRQGGHGRHGPFACQGACAPRHHGERRLPWRKHENDGHGA